MLARLNTRPSPNTEKTASRTVRLPSARHGGEKSRLIPLARARSGQRAYIAIAHARARSCLQIHDAPGAAIVTQGPKERTSEDRGGVRSLGSTTRRAIAMADNGASWRDLPHYKHTGIASKKAAQTPAAERHRAKDAISTALTRCLDGPVGHRRLGQSNDDQRQAQPFAIGAVSSSSPLYGRPHRSLKAGRNDSGPMRPLDYPSCRLSISVPHMPRTPSLSTTLESSGITPTGASPEITRSCDRPPLAHRPRRSGEPTVRTDHGTLKA